MSYANLLLQHQNDDVDGCQRVSCNRSFNNSHSHGLLIGGGGGGGGGNNNERMVISKEIAIGCTLEQKDYYQSQVVERTWCVYMRELDNVDMGKYVRRVSFRMTPRLPLRLHVADSSPFEITEVLDTDFPIEMQVEYYDTKMTPTIYIYQPKEILESKRYFDLSHDFEGEEIKDRMIFVNPSDSMRLSLLTPTPPKPKPTTTVYRYVDKEQTAGDGNKKDKVKTKVKQQQQQQPKWRLNIRGPLLPPLDKQQQQQD